MSKERESYTQRSGNPYLEDTGNQGYPTYYNAIPPPVGNNVVIPASFKPRRKSVVEAYLLWFVFGLLGFHHFYLNRPGFGVLYFFTLGLGGLGFLIDLFRMPYLVRESNRCLDDHTLKDKKNISDAYTLWFPFGLLGFHHFYLGRTGFGVLYFFTFGLCGIGWLVDLLYIPCLVKQANQRSPEDLQKKQLGVSYCIGLSPLGIFGIHHFYLNRPICGIFYFLTFGIAGIGWVIDWFRMPVLVKRANKNILEGPDNQRHLDDAYVAWMPFGLLGFHHYYLNRPIWGILYTFTFGLCGIGWLVDGCRMSCLLKECNRLLRERPVPTLYSGPQRGRIISKSGPNQTTPITASNTGFTGQGFYPRQQQPQQQQQYQQQQQHQQQQQYQHQQQPQQQQQYQHQQQQQQYQHQQQQQQYQQQYQQQQYPQQQYPQQQPPLLPGYQETVITSPSYMEQPPPYTAK